MKEGAIRKALKLRVEAYGGIVRPQAWLGWRGCPDVRVFFPDRSHGAVHNGRFSGSVRGYNVDVETKRPKGGVFTQQQTDAIALVEMSGGTALKITNLNELDAWLPPL